MSGFRVDLLVLVLVVVLVLLVLVVVLVLVVLVVPQSHVFSAICTHSSIRP